MGQIDLCACCTTASHPQQCKCLQGVRGALLQDYACLCTIASAAPSPPYNVPERVAVFLHNLEVFLNVSGCFDGTLMAFETVFEHSRYWCRSERRAGVVEADHVEGRVAKAAGLKPRAPRIHRTRARAS